MKTKTDCHMIQTFGIVVAVAVHSIKSGGIHFARHISNPGECETALSDCEVYLISTSRKN
jgi:hypothetical protein